MKTSRFGKQGDGSKEMECAIRYSVKQKYIRAALAFRRAIKLAPDELTAKMRRMGAEGHLRNAANFHSQLTRIEAPFVPGDLNVWHATYHRIKAAIARKAADLFAEKVADS